jgi:hypothetical protein
VGPSDSSDGPSDRPAEDVSTDSDAASTGRRPGVNPLDRPQTGVDISPDEVADETGAGVSHDPPDPVRNGGVNKR